MTKTLKILFLFILLLTFYGCTGTAKFDNSFTQNQASLDKATIKVIRSGSWVGGAVPAGVQDGTTKIGVLGPGGELKWYRDPGYVAVIASRAGNEPTHVVIFLAEAGKTYSLATEIHYAGRFTLEPKNFPKELIVYELKSESADIPLPDVWKIELSKLSKQKSEDTGTK